MPAGTATTPNIMNNLISELTPHAQEWSGDYGRLSPIVKEATRYGNWNKIISCNASY